MVASRITLLTIFGISSICLGFMTPRPVAKFNFNTNLKLFSNVSPNTDSESISASTSGEVDSSKLSQAQIEAIRLRARASQLRAEADALEAEQALVRAKETEKLFKSFDLNQNGVLDSIELREGLQRVLRQTVSPEAAESLLAELDANKDGVLQLSELPNVSTLSRLIDDIVQKQRLEASNAKTAALKAAEQAKIEEQFAAMINDRPSTPTDRILAALPYLLPLIDSLDYGSFLLKSQVDAGNPFVLGIVGIFALFRSIPLGQFALFLGLSFLGDRLDVNKLIRFNALQAVYLDVALFPASLLLALLAYLGGAGNGVPSGPSPILEYSSDFVFLVVALSAMYSIISTATGVPPNKLPLISNIVQKRMDRMSAREFMRRDKEDDDKK